MQGTLQKRSKVKTLDRLFANLLAKIEPPVEAIHAAAGVHQLLLARKERMALGADFHPDLRLGGTGLDDIAAGAANHRRSILGMDSVFHCFSPLS